MLELTELINKVTAIFDITDIKDLGNALYNTVLSNNNSNYEKYCKEIGNLDSDTLQPIFQYYMADRKEKCQDFTPKSLGMLLSGLIAADDEQEIYDMCAGCGSLTIQQWNANKGLCFICKEIDGNAIPFLLFNLAVRNINALVIHGDVLKNEDYARYRLTSGENFSKSVKEEV